jgi:hypothetical protein
MATSKSNSSKNWNSCGSIFFFSIFFAIGMGLTWFMAVAPMLKSREAANWREVVCVVQHIGIEVHHGDDATYSPEVSFSYTFNGQPYTGNQFWFGSGSHGDRRAIEKAIAPFQAGGEYPCFVNPLDPQEAVLTRQVASHTWLGWLFGGIFGLVGLGGMLAGLRSYFRARAVASKRSGATRDLRSDLTLKTLNSRGERGRDVSSDGLPEYAFDSSVCPIEEDRPDEPMILAPQASRFGIAIGSWFFALVWNAITWTIGYFAFQELHWFALVFVGLFLLVGFATILFSIYSTLQVWNPRTTVVCSQRNLYAGSEFEISWLHQGKSSSITELSIELEGEESATYRQGTTTRTDKSVFFKQTIVKTNEPSEISNGFRLVSLPADTMHSLQGTRNKIAWQVRVRGKIRFWPDIHDTFSITVYPPPIGGGSNAEN